MRTRLLALASVTLVAGGTTDSAQDTGHPPSSFRWFVGAGIGALHTDNPYGGKGVVEALVGAERCLSEGVSLRGTLRRHTTMQTGYTLICHMRPDNSCWPHPVIADSHWSLELATALSAGRGIPLAVVGGAGLAKPVSAGQAHPETGTAATQGAWRLRLEIGSTGGRRGARILVARTWFPAGLLDARHQTTVAIAIP